MNFKKTVVAVDLDEVSVKTLSQLNDLPFPQDAEIHLVHIFQLNYFTFDFLPTLRPSPEDHFLIQKLIEEKLQNVRKQLGLTHVNNIVFKCLISGNAKQEFLSYAEKVGATVIVAAAKEKEGLTGLFESSFTDFLNKFSRTNLVILKPQAK